MEQLLQRRARFPSSHDDATATSTTASSTSRTRATFSSINTTRSDNSNSNSSAPNPNISTTTPTRQRGSLSADLFTLSPIAEAESFSLKMPESPPPAPPQQCHYQHHEQQQHVFEAPMEVDSTTPSRTVHHTHHHHHHAHQNHSQPKDAKRPLLSVFDWDDTLCPSWWLYRNGVLASHGLVTEPTATATAALHAPEIHGISRFGRASSSTNAVPSSISARDRQRFTQLEDRVLSLLQQAMHMGPVFIITAATLQWVEACAHHFLPRVKLLFKQHADKVHVVSAREWYQQHMRCEGDPMMWKAATFNALCAHLQLEKVCHRLQHRVDFVSIGDSVFERDACRQMEKNAPAIVHSKTLKFVDRPSLQELLDQVTMTISIYERIHSHGGSLDLHITRNAKRQKGEPTLKLLQVDLSNQQSHLEPAVSAAVSTTASSGHHHGHQQQYGARFAEPSRVVHSKMPSYYGDMRASTRILTSL